MRHVLLPSSVPNPLEAQGRFICNAHLFVVFHGCGPNLPGDMGVMEYLPREQGVWDSPPRKLKTKLKKVFYASATYNIVSVEVLLNNVYCHPHHKLFTVPVPLPICTPAGSGLCLKIYPTCMPVQCHVQFYWLIFQSLMMIKWNKTSTYCTVVRYWWWCNTKNIMLVFSYHQTFHNSNCYKSDLRFEV